MPQDFAKAGSNDTNDISDLQLTTPDYAEISPLQLPIRGETRIIPSIVEVNATDDQIASGVAAGGQNPQARTNKVKYSDFQIKAALTPFTDFISVRIPHRGAINGLPDQTRSAVYRFLINPKTVNVTHQTVDAQSMTRAGWQFGVWGEDVVQINLQGQTAGQYFSLGTTDAFQAFTQSYRNLQQLVMVFQNNGYWFEGEELGEGPMAADFTRRRIKMHQDVELIVGNFVWSGMFDTMTVSQDANQPFLSTFTLSFIAWKERFRNSSPWLDSIHNEIQRGHSFSAITRQPMQTQNPQQLPAPTTDPQHTAPAVLAAANEEVQCTQDTTAQDQTPMFDSLNPSSPFSLFSRGF